MNLFSAETGLKASVGAFLLSCTFITTSYTTTFAFDLPLESALLACFFAAISLLITSRFVDSTPTIASPAHKYSAISLTELNHPAAEELLSPISNTGSFSSRKTLGSSRWVSIGLISGIGCVRISLYHQISRNIECAPGGYACVIPFLVALYDYWRNQRGRPNQKWTAPEGPTNAHLRKLVVVANRAYFFLCHSRLRNVLSAIFLMAGGLLLTTFHDGRQSTYICPITSGLYPRLRMYRFLNIILDTLILIGAAEFFQGGARPRDRRKKQALASWGYSFLGTAMVWTIILLILRKVSPGDDGGFVSSHYLRSSLGQSSLVTIAVLSASQLMPYYGVVGLSIVAGSVSSIFMLASVLFNGQEPFPLVLASHAFVALLLTFLGVMLYLFGQTASEEEPLSLYGFNIFMRIFFSVIFGIGLILVAHQPSIVNVHPIDLLIYEGRQHHSRWKANANGSKNLAGAVAQYRAKYSQHPPPGFDKWYEYATSRSSVVIDEFDQIHDNLLPFRALAPERIRELTHQLATNPFNDIGAISIRNGTPRVQQGIKPTHAWMVIGAAKMIEKFSEHLPDMDLAFNLNDEPRVSVPWEKMSDFRGQARSQSPPSESLRNGWSKDRNEGWASVEPADQTTETMFTDSSFINIFDRYVSALCPASSKARSQRIWDRHSICTSCIRPHSMGQFLSNWAVATDICHQPDLAFFHGFFVSPASFKVTQDLAPVFSQSTISGFGDIIFPSPWNYMDKIKYEPSEEHPDLEYVEKDNRLFWIGGTSEGVSRNGQWRGMPRQRLTHLVNNNTHKVSVLLPAEDPNTYSYQIHDGLAPTEMLKLNASVHVTDPIVRCRKDCVDQKEELGTTGWVDFQSHWNYRFLFDADGAGFSGRFLPFMQSHSLPFRTGLFRQWFDSRITAWLHFVPIDIRLHGLWSTLAYFAGVDRPVGVDENGQPKVMIEPHNLQGRWIAEEGRKWAEQALRKEDMEIYFFRLLLEWARLTDDQRDILGYTE
ncbi:hypothetical protein BDV28DRAFT_12181 [Aspergillus coremiiformis]|uniref:Glycosyl transferase CAP10 domain-containing protein n=1 Tax=Aspergillus coremiiformis TaxID=138285 RepID=A0A5N6Z2G7_9EURO|nr:hypothetical protein BDV28DRAFT_12181 [Aspergillus coremiiformis]